jgi:hypothetical protein
LNKTHPSTQQGGISCVVVVAGLILDLEHKKVKTIMPAELCHCPSELGYIEFRHARKQGISKGWTQRAKMILLCVYDENVTMILSSTRVNFSSKYISISWDTWI